MLHHIDVDSAHHVLVVVVPALPCGGAGIVVVSPTLPPDCTPEYRYESSSACRERRLEALRIVCWSTPFRPRDRAYGPRRSTGSERRLRCPAGSERTPARTRGTGAAVTRISPLQTHAKSRLIAETLQEGLLCRRAIRPITHVADCARTSALQSELAERWRVRYPPPRQHLCIQRA